MKPSRFICIFFLWQTISFLQIKSRFTWPKIDEKGEAENEIQSRLMNAKMVYFEEGDQLSPIVFSIEQSGSIGGIRWRDIR